VQPDSHTELPTIVRSRRALYLFSLTNSWWHSWIKPSQVMPAAGIIWQVSPFVRVLICFSRFQLHNNWNIHHQDAACKCQSIMWFKWRLSLTTSFLKGICPFAYFFIFALLPWHIFIEELSASVPQRLEAVHRYVELLLNLSLHKFPQCQKQTFKLCSCKQSIFFQQRHFP